MFSVMKTFFFHIFHILCPGFFIVSCGRVDPILITPSGLVGGVFLSKFLMPSAVQNPSELSVFSLLLIMEFC